MEIKGQAAIPELGQYIIFVPAHTAFQVPDEELDALVQEVIQVEKFTAKSEEMLPVVKGEKTCLLVGMGDSPEKMRARQIGVLSKNALQNKAIDPKRPVGVLLLQDTELMVRALVDGAKLGVYSWKKYRTVKPEENHSFEDLEIYVQTAHTDLVERQSIICDGVNLARDLGNENADVATPEYLSERMVELIGEDERCEVEILGRAELWEKGLGLHLAVSQGSEKDPKLVIVKYSGGKKEEPYTALVGKGITFDTGGLNLKRTGSMEDMRLDMCGSAAVIGALHNTLRLNLKCNVYFVCGLAENAIGAKAYKPGDIIKSYCGKTVEVLNTDAEGRLVLADANSYMAKNYKPDSIINIATLTGAVVMALGYEYTGLMASDDELASRLLKAAELSDDRAWRLPIYPELKEHVKSKFADIKNVGQPRTAGTISAGEFLRQFAQWESEEQKWAHLDIAGTGTLESDLGYLKVGSSGAGVRLFTEFLATM